MKILLAVDGSTCSLAAVHEIAHRRWPHRSQVRILSAIEMRLGPLAEPWILPHDETGILKAQRETALDIVSAAAAELRASSRSTLRVTTQIVKGPPKKVILDKAESWGADLIVLGSDGHGVAGQCWYDLVRRLSLWGPGLVRGLRRDLVTGSVSSVL